MALIYERLYNSKILLIPYCLSLSLAIASSKNAECFFFFFFSLNFSFCALFYNPDSYSLEFI